MKKSFVAVAAGSVILAGCTTVDPLTGTQSASRATTGAAIGAVGGALAGAVFGSAKGDGGSDLRRSVLIGAGVGLLTGGAIGFYMDEQERKLRARLQGTGVNVVRRGNEIILIMPSNITFASGQSTVIPSFFPALDGVSIVLQEYPKTLVDIVGHTDSDGSDSFNQQLSQNRAVSVGNYLAGRGVDARRLLITGAGEAQPVATNATAAGKALNRRVEIKIRPLQ